MTAVAASAALRFPFLRALRGRPFALLWAGQTVSRVGDFLYEIALAWWVLEETGSAAVMGTVLVASFTPMLLFLVVGGVAVDRFPRVPMMIASDVARGIIVIVVAVLASRGELEVPHVLVASVLFGFMDAFFQPAYAALVPQLAPRDDLPSANALSSLSVQLGRIAGPALGAGIIHLTGTAGAFAINGLSFFISALFLLPLLRLVPPRAAGADDGEEGDEGGFLAQARAGFRVIARQPVLWITILVVALTNVTLSGPYSVAMPFLVSEEWGADVGTLGLVYAVFPIGYILGGLWLGGATRIRRRGLLAYTTLGLAGVMLGLFGLPLPLVVLLAAALVNGAALEVSGLVWTGLTQELVPERLLGRVSSIDMLGSFVLLPIGFGLTGIATERLGPATVFLIGGGVTAALCCYALIHPAIRGLD
jgi:DHA3 family tetracycline resistance protein-like MFS transporter